tara:strand:- start:158 stop:562 length:405 start_codon:yes stop_codon:yes gene_type:complete
MLGGGNPVSGSNPAGTGQNLNYIGNHAYAYSGVVTDSSSGSAATTVLKFTTGNAYIVAKLSLFNDESGGAAIYVRADVNGEQILRTNTDSAASSAPFIDNPLHILFEPFSTFELKCGANASVDFTALIVGEVYA